MTCVSCKLQITSHEKLRDISYEFKQCHHLICSYCITRIFISSNFSVKQYTTLLISCPCQTTSSVIALSIDTLIWNLSSLNNNAIVITNKETKCKKHKDIKTSAQKVFIALCKECNLKMCQDCIIEHSVFKHKIKSLSEIKSKIENTTKDMKYSNYEEFAHSLNSNKYNFEKDFQEKMNDINNTLEYWISIFQEIKNNLDLEYKFQQKLFNLMSIYYRYYYTYITEVDWYRYVKNVSYEFVNFDIMINSESSNTINQIVSYVSEREEYISTKFLKTNSLLWYKYTFKPFEWGFSYNSAKYTLKDLCEITPHYVVKMIQLSNSNIALSLGNKVANIGNELIYIYNVISFRLEKILKGDANNIITNIIELKSDFLLTGSMNDTKIKIWDLSSTHEKYTKYFNAHLTPVSYWYKINKNQNIVISGSWDGEIIVWDINHMMQIQIFKEHQQKISSIWQLNDSRITVGSYDCHIGIYNCESSDSSIKLKEEFKLFKAFSKVNNIIQWKQSNYICSADLNGELNIWDLNSKLNILALKSHKGEIWDLINLRQGNIVSCGEDNTIKIIAAYEVDNIKCVNNIKCKSRVNKWCLLKDKRLLSFGDSVWLYTFK